MLALFLVKTFFDPIHSNTLNQIFISINYGHHDEVLYTMNGRMTGWLEYTVGT